MSKNTFPTQFKVLLDVPYHSGFLFALVCATENERSSSSCLSRTLVNVNSSKIDVNATRSPAMSKKPFQNDCK